MSDSCFSTTYAEARRRFTDAAEKVGAVVTSYGIEADGPDNLAIDVATLGQPTDPCVVVSSGIHGAEGFFGSAVQLALLDRLRHAKSHSSIRYVLVHGLNPFGFSRIRRFNEENVDLNRNFLIDPSAYEGAPDGYAALNRFLNPESPPSRFEPFKLIALWIIWCKGLQALKESIAHGQYEYPRGLFFGGKKPSESTRIVQANCDSWVASSEKIIHIDFHTGLGPFGTYKLLLTEGLDSAGFNWYVDTFGAEFVEPLAKPEGTAYTISGSFGGWMQNHFRSRDYHFVAAEFGTYEVLRVLKAIRAENRAHHYSLAGSETYRAAKKELLECFCPNDPTWRNQVLESGLNIIDQGMKGLGG